MASTMAVDLRRRCRMGPDVYKRCTGALHVVGAQNVQYDVVLVSCMHGVICQIEHFLLL